MDDTELEARVRGVLALAEREDVAPGEDLFDAIVQAGTAARRRRAASVGVVVAAVVAAALAVGPMLWRADLAVAPASPTATGAVTPAKRYIWTKWPTPSTTPPRPTNAVEIPDVMPKESELNGMEYSPDGVYEEPGGPAAFGVQGCDPISLGPESTPAPDAVGSIAGANVLAWTPDEAWSADITVTVWSDERGWQQVVDDTGICRLFHFRVEDWAGAASADAKYYVAELGHQRAVVRHLGQVIVAVNVGAPSGTEAESEAQRISDLVVANVEAQAGPWTEGR